MKAQELYSGVIWPVFEEKLINYFKDMFGVHTGIIFLPYNVNGSISIDAIDEIGYATNVISFFFYKDGDVHCSKRDDETSYVKFITHLLVQKDLRKDIENVPQCFKKRRFFVFHVKQFEGKSIEYIKQEFLKSFLDSFCLTYSYTSYIKEQERLRMEKLMGEVVF